MCMSECSDVRLHLLCLLRLKNKRHRVHVVCSSLLAVLPLWRPELSVWKVQHHFYIIIILLWALQGDIAHIKVHLGDQILGY